MTSSPGLRSLVRGVLLAAFVPFLLPSLSGCGDDGAPSDDTTADDGTGTAGDGDGDPTGDGDGDGDEPALAQWTQGHGDLSFALQEGGNLRAFWNLGGVTLDGETQVSGEYELSDVAPTSLATFERPAEDGGAFDALCVADGQKVQWLPQNNRDAVEGGSPFLGISNSIDRGVLENDELSLTLMSVESPSGAGAYALWRDGFPPRFFMSSCDNIDESDGMPLPVGHDHFNMGFSEPGEWTISYRLSGRLEATGDDMATDFEIHYVLE